MINHLALEITSPAALPVNCKRLDARLSELPEAFWTYPR
jgi:hypothetical protein